jgi:predicted RNA-binding protein with PIN domain
VKTKQTWILDGHNVIFAIPQLEQLQTSGKRRQARDALVALARRFGASRQERVTLIFDGTPGYTQGAEETSLLEVVFAAYEGKADDMIVLRSDRAIEGGKRVTVVTDDQDLRGRLHKNAAVIGTQQFWQLNRVKRKPTGEEMPQIPLKDVEAIFLGNEEALLEELRNAPPPKIPRPRESTKIPSLKKPARTVSWRPNPAPSPPPRHAAPAKAVAKSKENEKRRLREDALRLKKEKGLNKQARRLANQRKKKR